MFEWLMDQEEREEAFVWLRRSVENDYQPALDLVRQMMDGVKEAMEDDE